MKNEIILFDNQNVKLEVNMKDETVWLNRNQIATLFDRDIKTIGKHINNVLNEELNNETVVAKFATTTKHGKMEGKTQTHMVDYYNLDMIISVGYRVKSNRGIVFRRWANNILKEYLVKGCAINTSRLEYLEKTVKLINIASRVDAETKEIIQVINKYSYALNLLDDYDHKRITKPAGIKKNDRIKYEECIEIIKKLKFTNDSSLFALERNKGLESIIENVYQSFNQQDLYPTTLEKAANFLYLIVKNHVFIDGNKRIGAILFIYFLEFYGLLYKCDNQVIDNNTLVPLPC